MNIAFIYDYVILPHNGGTERVTYSVSNILRGLGHKVFFVSRVDSCCDKMDNQFLLPDSIRWNSQLNIDFLNDFINKYSIDVIINQDSYSESVTLCNHEIIKDSVKIISAIHFSIFDEYRWFGYRIKPLYSVKGIANKLKTLSVYLRLPYLKRRAIANRKKRLEYLLRNTDYVSVLSSQFVPEVAAALGKYADKVVVLPNPNSFSLNENDLSIKKDKTVLYVGRLSYYEKRPDRIIRIWKKVEDKNPDWKLIVIGDGPEIKNLINMKDKMGLRNVEFKGKVDSKDFFKTASIVCLTSNFEGFGMTLTEGMQYGAVPICFNSYRSASDIIIDGYNGCLIRPFDFDEYAMRLSRLMSDPQKRQEMSDSGREFVKKFDVNQIGLIWTKFLGKI